MPTATTATAPPPAVVRRIAELATRAPSFHNTQPWRWRARGATMELWADRSRQLGLSDPEGRNLTLSCGAALHHAVTAAGALGWSADTRLQPDPRRPDLLARLTLSPAPPTPEAGEVVEAIKHRCTDRRRFTSWPVPDEVLLHLAACAEGDHVRAVALLDETARHDAEALVATALAHHRAAADLVAEQQDWVDHGTADGVPSDALPAAAPDGARPPGRFPPGGADDPGRELEGTDGLVVLCTAAPTVQAWLDAGRGLSALWLQATRQGLSVVPLSQAVEDESTRAGITARLLHGYGEPLLLVRVGWQAISRSDLPRTPRRPLADVLDL